MIKTAKNTASAGTTDENIAKAHQPRWTKISAVVALLQGA